MLATLLGSSLLLIGCAVPAPPLPGTAAYLVAPQGQRVLALVPTQQERWTGGRLAWFPAGLRVIGADDPAARVADPRDLPADAAGPLVPVVVAAGPHEGVEIFVSRLHLGAEPPRVAASGRPGLGLLGLATLILLGVALGEPCRSWLADRGRRGKIRHRFGAAGRLAPPARVIERDDERWLAWLRGQRAKQIRVDRCYEIR